MLDKQTLRAQFRQCRGAISCAQQKEKAKQLLSQVISLKEFTNSQHIAAYWPHDGEINPLPLLELANSMGKCCYLPVLHPIYERQLWFVKYQVDDCLTSNRFGILEPKLHAHNIISVRALDLILLPVVAFDEQGGRLGMGGGYYDWTLSFLMSEARSAKPHLWGLAYEIQCLGERLPVDSWDIPLSGIVTENRYLRIP